MLIKTTIKQSSREVMRATIRTLKAKGITCHAIDNGSQYKGSDRWSVVILKQRETLTAPRKPTGNTFASMEHNTAHSAVQWLSQRPSHNVDVFYKMNYRRHMMHM